MSEFTDDFADALQELEDVSLVSITFTWNGATFPGFASKAVQGGTLEQFGFAVKDNVTILARGNLWPADAAPKRGHTIILDGDTHRIDQVQPAPGRAFLRFYCVASTRGS